MVRRTGSPLARGGSDGGARDASPVSADYVHVSNADLPAPTPSVAPDDGRLVGATIHPGGSRAPSPPAALIGRPASPPPAATAATAHAPAPSPVPLHPVYKYPVMLHHERRRSVLSHFFRGHDVETDDPPPEEMPTYRGLLNLSLILLTLSNVRLMIENIRKYGVLVDVAAHFTDSNPREWPALLIIASMAVPVALALALEHVALRHVQGALRSGRPAPPGPVPLTPTPVVSALQGLNVLGTLVYPIFAIHRWHPNPAANIVVMMCSVVLAAKLWSYSDVNARLREIYELKVRQAQGKEDGDKLLRPAAPTEYPNNLHGRDLAYFIAAPTLCYETNYPRTPKIRWGFLAKRVLELLIIAFVEYFIAVQYMLPLLQNTLAPFSRMEFVFLSERILKLAVPNLFVWILGFYAFFHLYLNILAELLRFDDRLFYKDWWNCTTVGTFWKTWNLSVHFWFVQHVYRPLRARGYSRFAVLSVIFFISAVFHELIVSVAFSTVSFFAFGGMMAQVLAIWVSESLRGKQIGNVFFWLTIMLGQPLIVLFYFVDYVRRTQAVAVVPTAA